MTGPMGALPPAGSGRPPSGAVGPAGPFAGPEPGTAVGPVLAPADAGLLAGYRSSLTDPVSSAALLRPDGPAVGGRELVTCPECGTAAEADPAQRRAEDFCARCDFPLFWARSTVVLPSGEQTGASLRRLPGTIGRAATASVPCPHCGEPNSPAAEICVRCSLTMHPAPEPEPVVVQAPPPPPLLQEPEPEPEPRSLWWLWVVLIVATALLVIGTLLWITLS